jgi:hypothetical protein
MPKYNGHPSYNAWNNALWINNDEGLYTFAKELKHQYGTARKAAEAFVEAMQEAGQCKTPDGAPWTVTNVARALGDL